MRTTRCAFSSTPLPFLAHLSKRPECTHTARTAPGEELGNDHGALPGNADGLALGELLGILNELVLGTVICQLAMLHKLYEFALGYVLGNLDGLAL